MKSRKTAGFTIAELLIVVAIIAVLVAVAIPVFNNQLESSREGVDIANLRHAYSYAKIAMLTGEYKNNEIWKVFTPPGGVPYYYCSYDGSEAVEDNTVTGMGKATNEGLIVDTSDLPEGIIYRGYPKIDYLDAIEMYICPSAEEVCVWFQSEGDGGLIDWSDTAQEDIPDWMRD